MTRRDLTTPQTASHLFEQWDMLCEQLLPSNLQDLACQHKAIFPHQKRAKIVCAKILLRLLFAVTLVEPSFASTSAMASVNNIIDVSHVAIYKAMARSVGWLSAILAALLQSEQTESIDKFDGLNVLFVDATCVCPGESKDTQKIHMVISLATSMIVNMVYNAYVNVGETFKNFQPIKDALYVADRMYCSTVGLSYLWESGAWALVRYRRNLGLYNSKGEPFCLKKKIKSFEVGEVGEWCLWSYSKKENKLVGCRVIAMKLNEEGRANELARLKAGKNKMTADLKFFAGYVIVVTTAPRTILSTPKALALYRLRWGIENYFKRVKSIGGFGRKMRCKTESQVRSWVLIHLIAQVMVDRLQGQRTIHQPLWNLAQLAWRALEQAVALPVPIYTFKGCAACFEQALPKRGSTSKPLAGDVYLRFAATG